MSERFLIISDLHIKGGKSVWLEAFTKKVLEVRPDFIGFLGDLCDFDSCARYLKNHNGLTPEQEVEEVLRVLDTVFFQPIKELQDRQRRMKKKIWKPITFYTMGNHDDRVKELLVPALKSRFNIVTLSRSYLKLRGVIFSHTIDKGVTGTTCTTAKDVLCNTFCRSVSGHSHVRDWAEITRPDGLQVFVIKAPCGTDEYPAWVGHHGKAWNRGFLSLTLHGSGRYAFRFYDEEDI